jgi:phospholipid transport system transporter-binding protein
VSAVLTLPPVLCLAQASACAKQFSVAVQRLASAQVVVDASALLRFDSSALAVLLDCRRMALARGKSFAVSGMVPRLQALAGLYGVTELLPAP